MRNFANSLILPFKGATGAQAITAHKKSNQPPQAISLDIPWRAYALDMAIGGGVTVFNGAVSIDLSRGTVSNPLDIVKSVFIDNTAVDRPVYLRCEDTGQIVTCADGSFGWFPLLTYGEAFTLFTDNIIPLRDGDQKTKLIFSNASFDTFAGGELNRAQQLFRSSGTSNFTTPVLGDKIASVVLTVPDTQVLIPATPNSLVVITGIYISSSMIIASSIATYTHALQQGGADIFTCATRSQSTAGEFQVAYNNSQMQLTLDGKTDISVQTRRSNSTNSGIATFVVTYARLILPALSA